MRRIIEVIEIGFIFNYFILLSFQVQIYEKSPKLQKFRGLYLFLTIVGLLDYLEATVLIPLCVKFIGNLSPQV